MVEATAIDNAPHKWYLYGGEVVSDLKVPMIYTGPDGETHWGETALPEVITAPTGDSPQEELLRGMVKSGGKPNVIPCLGAFTYHGWRPNGDPKKFTTTNRRQFVVLLEGSHILTTSDGESRRFGPGEIYFVNDTTGKGHKTVGFNKRVFLFMPVSDDFEAVSSANRW